MYKSPALTVAPNIFDSKKEESFQDGLEPRNRGNAELRIFLGSVSRPHKLLRLGGAKRLMEPAYAMVLLPLLGLIIGSFLALLSVRLPQGAPIVCDRSRCPNCARVLSAYELIPVLSYFALQRRCRSCGQPIPGRYVLIELAAAAIGLVAASVYQGPQAAAAAALGWTVLILSILDLEHFWLPDSITFPLILAGLAFTWLIEPLDLFDHAFGAVAGFTAFSLVRLVYRHFRRREGMGGGDSKLFAASGAWLGWDYLPFVLLLSTLLALAIVLFTLRIKSYSRTSALPFGPFLGTSTWCLYLAQSFLQIGNGL